MKKPKVESHRVTIVVTPECDDHMTENQMKRWVQKQFEGCEYGSVRVTDVFNNEVKKAR